MPKIYYDARGFPLYDKNDGWKDEDTFQAAALNDMASRQQKQTQSIAPSVSTGRSIINAGGHAVANALPMIGGMAAEIPGWETGPIAPIAGAAAGSATANYLRQLSPETFGEAPGSNLENIANVGINAATQGLLPGILKAASTKGLAQIAPMLLKSGLIKNLVKSFSTGGSDVMSGPSVQMGEEAGKLPELLEPPSELKTNEKPLKWNSSKKQWMPNEKYQDLQDAKTQEWKDYTDQISKLKGEPTSDTLPQFRNLPDMSQPGGNRQQLVINLARALASAGLSQSTSSPPANTQ